MNLFALAVVADPARTEDVRRAIVDAHRRTTPFADQEHDSVLFTGNHTVGASFSIHAAATSIGAYAHATDTTFDTFAGLPRLASRASGRPWAQTLAELRDREQLQPRELGGVWALARADRHTIEVHASSTGSEPLFLARRPGLVLVGNRALLVRLAAWPEFAVAYDTDALSTLCTRGWLAHDRAPLSGLQLLSPGVHLRAARDGVSMTLAQQLTDGEPLVETPEAPDAALPPTLVERYDTIAGELTEAAREVAALGLPVELELTGDLNTRLGAAVYAASGVEVTAVTPAPTGSPHAVVAGEVAAAAGFDHRCEPVEVARGELGTLTRRQVLHAEGMSNVFDPCPPLAAQPRLHVSRHAAGALLGGYDNLPSGPRAPVTDIAQARRFLDDLALHNSDLLLREEARATQEQINQRTAEELYDEVGALSFHELAYLRLREGRGNGANRQAAAYGMLQPAPMLDDRVLRHLGAIPLEHKRSQRAAFELITRLAPALGELRFVGQRWRFEQDGPSSLLDPEGYDARAPLSASTSRSARTGERRGSWRLDDDGSLLPALVKRLREPDRLLDEIVDRRRLLAALDAPAPPVDRDLRSLFGAYTASHLLGGDWEPNGRRAGRRRARHVAA